jgi:protein TonB
MRLHTAYGISAFAHVVLLAAIEILAPNHYLPTLIPVSGGGGLSIEFMPHGIPGAAKTAVAFESPQELPVLEEVSADPAPADVTVEATEIHSSVVRSEVPPPTAVEPQAVSIETPAVLPEATPTPSNFAAVHAPNVAAAPAALPSRRVARQGPATASHAVSTEVAVTSQQKGNGGGGGAMGGRVDSLPQKGTYNLPPTYPIDALLARAEGRVVLRAEVSSAGLVDDLAVERSSGWPSLDEAALEAVRRWRFAPARKSGVAVACQVLVPVRFNIRQE